MITIDIARETAKRHVRALGEGLTLFEEPIASGDYGWVFSYESTVFIETNDISYAMAGNAPLLIERDLGRLFTLGTAYDVSRYVQMYLRFGDPHAEPGSFVELSGWRNGANKVAATTEIKKHTEFGLKDAKGAVDGSLQGETQVVKCANPEIAEALARKLCAIGFEVRHLAKSDD